MDFTMSEGAQHIHRQVKQFMEELVYPAEEALHHPVTDNRWSIPPIMEELKREAKSRGLWNLFLHPAFVDSGLSNVDYAPICETMGRVFAAPEIFNCSAPDTGNMEVLLHYGSEQQKARWLTPLLDGEIRSAFAMTEPEVASSDATNICTRIERQGEHYLVDGRKWWTSGAADPRCELFIVMGKTDPGAAKYQQHSMIIVPRDAPGVEVVRNLTVFGFDDAPHGHCEVVFDNVKVPAENILLGEGRGFEIAQGRLGPGRIHHCMRALGAAERALELMCRRAKSREAFGGPLYKNDVVLHNIARSRIEIDQARLLTLRAAYMMDTVGNKAARREIAMIKVVALQAACAVIDRAIAVHGAMGVSQDTFLAHAYSIQRALRFGDGPDEVHMAAVGKLEMRKYL
jgi:acyl-CoA dehydrogenase